jgi:hypothetical protein
MNKELLDFCFDTESPEKNYALASWYENQGHNAAGHTYYQRCAERSENDISAYKSLIRASICYRKQSSRDCTEKILLENALNLLPNRPEAYFLLSSLYERRSEWVSAYTYANLGINCYKEKVEDIGIPEFHGIWGLIFNKAVVSWNWGKNMESRKLFHHLVDNYWDVMDNYHKDLVEVNITSLGSGPESQAFFTYNKEDHKKLKFKFKGSENIERNFSQVYQDIFILSVLNGKRNGTYLEIGGADPFKGNNTALLERDYGWTGVSLEYDEKFIRNYRDNRKNPIYQQDALDLDYDEFIQNNFQSNIIDYLQLDIEPARHTYECMLKIPFDKYKFAVITYEHDYYVDVSKSYREKSRKFLEDKGYLLVINDVSPDGVSNFEDWWVHPDLVSEELIGKMKSIQPHTQLCTDFTFISEEEETVKKYNLFKECKCEWCIESSFPRLYSLNNDKNEYWFEIPKNGSASIKGHFVKCQEIEDRPKVKPIVVLDDPIDRFISLMNDYFVIPNYHNLWGQDILKSLNLDIEKSTKDEIIKAVIQNLDKITSDQQVHHWYPQTHFIDQRNYDSFEVIFKKDINRRFGVDKIINCSKKKFGKDDLTENQIDIIRRIYISDYIFIENYADNETIVEEKPMVFSSFSSKPNPTSWIVDNFYENPDEIRKFALEQDFDIGGLGRGYIGNRTHKQFLFPGLKERFEEIMGQKITKWEEHGMNGRFQYCWSGQPRVWHCDSQQWGGMLYLTPNAPFQCGTTLYAHKQSRARTYYEPGWDISWNPETNPGDCHLDGTPFEPVDVLGNVYNRLVLFDASAIHSASEYFGTVKENCRLWQMFFFDT